MQFNNGPFRLLPLTKLCLPSFSSLCPLGKIGSALSVIVSWHGSFGMFPLSVWKNIGHCPRMKTVNHSIGLEWGWKCHYPVYPLPTYKNKRKSLWVKVRYVSQSSFKWSQFSAIQVTQLYTQVLYTKRVAPSLQVGLSALQLSPGQFC